jgi:hypothetical protein
MLTAMWRLLGYSLVAAIYAGAVLYVARRFRRPFVVTCWLGAALLLGAYGTLYPPPVGAESAKVSPTPGGALNFAVFFVLGLIAFGFTTLEVERRLARTASGNVRVRDVLGVLGAFWIGFALWLLLLGLFTTVAA